MKNARARRARMLFFIVKYANDVTFLLQSSSWLRKLANEKDKLYRNKILALTRQSKKLYYFTYFSNHINNMKKIAPELMR